MRERAAGSPPLVQVQVWGVDRVAPALLRMATGRLRLRGVPGLRFAKLLGTGSGESFTLRDADPHHWALVSVWDDAASADRFGRGRVVGSWDAASHERLQLRLRTLTARGRWSGRTPFEASTPRSPGGPVVALTRARLRPTQVATFRRAVPPVVADLHAAPGLRLSLGIGEAPVGLQGTLSLWDSDRDLIDFAYRGAPHREVITRTHETDWYAEELFARFAVLESTGTHRGRTP